MTLRQLLRPDPAEIHVEPRSVPARTVAAISGHVELGDSVTWYDSAMADLDAGSHQRNAPDHAAGTMPTSCLPTVPG
jgi:hypothetical protein